MTDSGNQESAKNKKGCWIPLLIGCGGLILLGLLIGGVYLYAGWLGYQEAPRLVEDGIPSGAGPAGYGYSSEQEQVLIEYGSPEGFTILFYQEEAEDASPRDVRLETWRYYSLGKGITFINGELQTEEALEVPNPGELSPLPYTPDQFTAYLSLEEVLAAAGLDRYLVVPLENEYLEEGNLYYGRSLSFGLQKDQLRYVEALAVTSGQ